MFLPTLKILFPSTDEPGKPGKPDIIDYDNKSVTLKWAKPEKDGGRPIMGYLIEVKDKFTTDWTECLKTENDNVEAKVSLNYKLYGTSFASVNRTHKIQFFYYPCSNGSHN